MAAAIAAPVEPQFSATLTNARQDLQISQLTQKRIENAIASLRERGNVDPAVLKDYMTYLDRVSAMTQKQQQVVQSMEAVSGELALGTDDGGWPQVDPIIFQPEIPETEDELASLERELLASLESFDAWLLEEQMEAHRRMEQIDSASSQEMTDLAREAAAAVERLRDKGIDVETGAPSESETQEGNPSDQPPSSETHQEGSDPGSAGSPGTPGSPGPPGAEPGPSGDQQAQGQGPTGGRIEGGGGSGSGDQAGEQTEGAVGEPGGDQPPGDQSGEGGSAQEGEHGQGAGEDPEGDGEPGDAAPGGQGTSSGSGSGVSGSGDPAGPPQSGSAGGAGEEHPDDASDNDRPPADDDDIVARQLREAAERETDPELKKKLWEEYDRYKGIDT